MHKIVSFDLGLSLFVGAHVWVNVAFANLAKIEWAKEFLEKCGAQFDSVKVEQRPSPEVLHAVLSDKNEVTAKAVI